MKKLLIIFVCILLIVSAFYSTYAGLIYEIPELKLTYVMPQNWVQLSRNASYNCAGTSMMGMSNCMMY